MKFVLGNVQHQFDEDDYDLKIPQDDYKYVFEEPLMENTDSNILSVIVENGAVYIAGWVGRKIMNCIDFDTCRQAIVDVNHHDISTGHQ